MKKNCWEIKQCGRVPGELHAENLRVCPAAICRRLDGVHGGHNAGRACWAVSGTLCSGKVQGTFANKHKDCEQCEFFKQVKEEEGPQFQAITALLRKGIMLRHHWLSEGL